MRILFVCEGVTVPSTRFRVEQYLPFLRQAGHDCTVRYGYGSHYNQLAAGKLGSAYKAACAARKVLALRDAKEFDLLVLQRSVLPFNSWAERGLWALGVPFVLDFDDAVHLGRGGVPSRARARTLGQVAAWAARVTAGNSFLAELAAQPSKTTIVPTAIDTSRYLPAVSRVGGVVLGWIGSAPNLPFVRDLAPTLAKVLQRNPNVRVRIVSNAHLTELDRIERIEQTTWSAESEIADLQSFDIGLMPLFDSDHCRGKCGFKLIQYMAMGIPVIASRVGANIDVLGSVDAGILVPPGDDWEPALQKLIEDASLRRAMGEAGRARVVEHYDAAKISSQYLSVFEGAVS